MNPLLDEIKETAQRCLFLSDVSEFAWVQLPADVPTAMRYIVPPRRIGGAAVRDRIVQAEARVERARLISDRFGALDVYLAVAPEIETVYYRYTDPATNHEARA